MKTDRSNFRLRGLSQFYDAITEMFLYRRHVGHSVQSKKATSYIYISHVCLTSTVGPFMGGSQKMPFSLNF
jgi:hypothetical protein